MKRCSECEFIYEDDQRVCDMDGTELSEATGMFAFSPSRPERVPDPRPFPFSETIPSLSYAHPGSASAELASAPFSDVSSSPVPTVSPSFFHRFLHSQFSLAALALFGVISSALVIGYYDSVSQGASNAETREAAVSLVPSAQAETKDSEHSVTDEDSRKVSETTSQEGSPGIEPANVSQSGDPSEGVVSSSSRNEGTRRGVEPSGGLQSGAAPASTGSSPSPVQPKQLPRAHQKKESRVRSVLRKTRRILTKPFRR